MTHLNIKYRSLGVLSLISLLLVSQATNDKTEDLVRLSLSNPADVYLISEFIVAITAYGKCKQSLQYEIQSPLGFLSDLIYVQEFDNFVYFWNKKTGRILLILERNDLDKYYKRIVAKLKEYDVKLEVIFNELLGINDIPTSDIAYEFYSILGNIFAEIVGIVRNPKGLFNMNGILVYIEDFPAKVCVITDEKSPLKEFYRIRNLEFLTYAIASTSVLLDGAAYWNIKFIFKDCIFPVQTKSGYKIGKLVGRKALTKNLTKAIKDLISTNYGNVHSSDLLVSLLNSIALDLPFEFDSLFDQRNQIVPPIVIPSILHHPQPFHNHIRHVNHTSSRVHAHKLVTHQMKYIKQNIKTHQKKYVKKTRKSDEIDKTKPNKNKLH